VALTLTELDAYTLKRIVPKTTDVIYLQSPIFTRLHTRNMERFNGGLQIQRPLIVGELNGGAIGRGEAMNIDFVTTDTALVNDMKVYYVGITLYGFDSMRNDGELAIFSQVEAKFTNASLKMAKLLAVDMYLDGQGARTKMLNGFKEWYDDGNNFATVGGITRSDVTTVGTVGGLNAYTSTGLTSFTLRTLNTAYTQSWFGADHVDMIVVTKNGWDLIWNALQPMQRFYDKESDVGQCGFQSLRFNASEVVIDQYMPTGTNGVMYGLNSKYIEWYFSTNPKFQFGFTGFKEANNSIDVAGQFLVGSNLIVPNPRSGFHLASTLF